MTTNKPEVVAWYTPTTRDTLPVVALNDRSQRGEPLIRLSDYEALQAECEKLRPAAATEQQIQRAAQHLPEDWRIAVEVEKDSGWVSLYAPDGILVEINEDGSLAEQIEQAINAAMAKEAEK